MQYKHRRHETQIFHHLTPNATQVVVLVGAQHTSALRNQGEFQADQLVNVLNCSALVLWGIISYVKSDDIGSDSPGSGV
ncbi:MAG: hypothetical protein QMC37_08870, partial [Flavobacteriales bacterium]